MAWNLLLRFLLQEKGIAAAQIGFDTFTPVLPADFLDTMETQKGWKASTRNNRLSCIRSFFKYAAYTCPNVYAVYADLGTVPLKKGVDNSRVVEYMSKDAVASIIGCAGTASPKGFRDRFFLTLMYDTAARNGEMLKLKLSDINTDNATIYLFGKGSKPRLVPVSRETLQMFDRYRVLFHNESKNESPLFYTKHRDEKTPMSDDNVARFLKGYAAKARKQNGHVPANVHPHMFRHSRAMHLYQGGMPLAVLSEFLGHEDPETTLIYAYADTEMKRQAIEKASANTLLPETGDNSSTWETQDIIERLIRGY
ncbi:MAG: site-specific integrase [Blautia sp.]|nr:site-specific integrase [Blautia sp.]